MLVFASIITQLIEAQANKNSRWRIMHGNYAGFARSVVAVADFFTRQALAGSRHDGLSELGQNRDANPDPVPLGHLVPGTLVDSPTSVD
jgi:hypothetical protein